MSPDGGPIEEKDCLRDLGVQVSTDLTFSAQIAKTVQELVEDNKLRKQMEQMWYVPYQNYQYQPSVNSL